MRQIRVSTARKDDVIAPHRLKFYSQRNELLFNSQSAIMLVRQIATANNISNDTIENHIDELYLKTKELLKRSLRNNQYASYAWVAFSNNRHSFTIYFNIYSVINSREGFDREFKKQVLLQVSDMEWKNFVIYMMGDLDSHEIDLLDERYEKMMDKINAIVLSRLTNSIIIFDEKKQEDSPENIENSSSKPIKAICVIVPDELCPCGSKKNTVNVMVETFTVLLI